ncbi:MAG: redoxin domain-containing protein [Myxococcales bacterium]|nr:redoxin domain-containing protein [Myxococcales bacterium]
MSTETAPPAPAPAAASNGLPSGPGLIYALFAVLAAGLGVSIWLVRHKLHITLDPTYVSSCNLGGAINCDKVNVSGWSEVFGLPVSLLAVPTYAVQGYLGYVALGALKATDAGQRAIGATALSAAAGIGILTVLFSMFLAYYSTSVVEAYCLYCISLYAVNLTATGLAIAAGPKTVGKAIETAFAALVKFAEPVPLALGVVVIAGGGAWLAYDSVKARMETEYKAKIDAQFGGGAPAAQTTVAAAQGSGSITGGAGAQTAPVAAAGPAGAKQGCLQPGEHGGQKTDDGWTLFNTPLDEQDSFFGPQDAKVTVVKYSDFECPYCRYLALTMEPLKEKYKDKVRFVMKHFPMNPTCNRYMQGYDKHPNACNAHITAVCANHQGKFWDMHDKLYANQPKLDPVANRQYAQELGLDLAKYDECVKDPKVLQRLTSDIELTIKSGAYGAPRTYINNRLVTGSASTSILDYYIQKALASTDHCPEGGYGTNAAAQALAPKPDGSHMLEAKTARGSFWIDPYEASLSKDGRALSLPNVEPAMASWMESEAACKKAGKRLCTEEEWVSACTATPAIDENTNQQFADDNVEGNMYPYGSFYEAGKCVDQEDKYKGKPLKTGIKEGCRTASGLFDLGGNIGEWTGTTKETAGQMGGHVSSGERAACNQRSASFGIGNRNMTTGFRCCADQDVVQQGAGAGDVQVTDADLVGKPVPAFKVKADDGTEVDTAQFKGKVTLLNFFASWCGPCKKEMPELVALYKQHKGKGFQVFSIGVDRETARAVEFAKGFEVPFPIIGDPESELMGQFNVYSMPATFIIDRQGVVRYYATGFKPEEQLEPLRNAITSQL